MDEIKIINVASTNSDLASLIINLDGYLGELYPAEEIFVIDFNAASVDEVYFVVAYINDRPVGCGAIRPLESTVVELKRFFVEPEYRNLGIAGKILKHLEEKARELNNFTLKLETGEHLIEAVNFYKKNGYYKIERFGEYASCEASLCFEKSLS